MNKKVTTIMLLTTQKHIFLLRYSLHIQNSTIQSFTVEIWRQLSSKCQITSRISQFLLCKLFCCTYFPLNFPLFPYPFLYTVEAKKVYFNFVFEIPNKSGQFNHAPYIMYVLKFCSDTRPKHKKELFISFS